MSESIDMTPTWAVAIRIHLAVLDNPNAPKSVKESAREEIMKCAKALDAAQAYIKAHQNAGGE